MTDADLAKHKKYRRQCQVRIKSGVKLIVVISGSGALLVLFNFQFWPFVVGVLALFTVGTLLELWAYRRHDRACRAIEASMKEVSH